MRARSGVSNTPPQNDYLLASKLVHRHRSAPTGYLFTTKKVTNICRQERVWGKWPRFCHGGCRGQGQLSDRTQQALGRNWNCCIILPGQGCDGAVPRQVTLLGISDSNSLEEGRILLPVTYT